MPGSATSCRDRVPLTIEDVEICARTDGELVLALHTNAGVIDEYQLFVHPVVVAKGKRLFKDGIDPTLLSLESSQSFGTGVVELRYRYKGKAKA